MTTARLIRMPRVSRVGIVLLSAALCAPAAVAGSADRQVRPTSPTSMDTGQVARLTFTGTFRFQPAAIILGRSRAKTLDGSGFASGTRHQVNQRWTKPQRTAVEPRNTVQSRSSTSKSKVSHQSRPILSRATRSSLGAVLKSDGKSEIATARPVTAAIARPVLATPPLPARLRRPAAKKTSRKARTARRVVRTAKRTPPRRNTRIIEPPPSTVFDEPAPWAKRALFKSN